MWGAKKIPFLNSTSKIHSMFLTLMNNLNLFFLLDEIIKLKWYLYLRLWYICLIFVRVRRVLLTSDKIDTLYLVYWHRYLNKMSIEYQLCPKVNRNLRIRTKIFISHSPIYNFKSRLLNHGKNLKYALHYLEDLLFSVSWILLD